MSKEGSYKYENNYYRVSSKIEERPAPSLSSPKACVSYRGKIGINETSRGLLSQS